MKNNKRNRKNFSVQKKQSKKISLWKRFLQFSKYIVSITSFIKFLFYLHDLT
jgi:hypothetical protein